MLHFTLPAAALWWIPATDREVVKIGNVPTALKALCSSGVLCNRWNYSGEIASTPTASHRGLWYMFSRSSSLPKSVFWRLISCETMLSVCLLFSDWMACFVYLCTAGCSVVHYGKMGEGVGEKWLCHVCACFFFCFIDFLNPAVMQEKNDLGGKQ